jgi:competence protein ComEA
MSRYNTSKNTLTGILALALLALMIPIYAPGQQSASHTGAPEKSIPLIDLNTASSEQLRALPGMGANYVKRVIAGRPYTAKNQLMTRGILPQAEYETIKDRIVARRTAQ